MDPNQFNEMSNIRMPRACKRGRKSQAEQVSSTTRGRRGRCAATPAPRNNPAYPPQAPVSDHNANYANSDHEAHMQNMLSAHYQRPPMEPADNETQSCRYRTRAQRTNPYARPETNNNTMQISNNQSASNQILYPNLMPRTTTVTYAVPEQLPQLTTATAHSAAPRYNTRSAVHNLPLSAAPTMDRYWGNNPTRTPAPQPAPVPPNPPTSRSTAQQTNTPTQCAPVQSQKERKSAGEDTDRNKKTKSGTDLELSEAEAKLIKLMRKKRIDAGSINMTIKNDDYIVTIDEGRKRNVFNNSEVYDAIVEQSANLKNVFNMLLAKSLEGAPPGRNNTRAQSRMITSSDEPPKNGQMHTPALPSCALQNRQDEIPNMLNMFSQALGQPDSANNENDGETEVKDTVPNVEPPFTPPNASFLNQHFHNVRNMFMQMQVAHLAQQQFPMGPPQDGYPNACPYPFPQNVFHDFPGMYMNPRTLPRPPPNNSDQFGNQGWH